MKKYIKKGFSMIELLFVMVILSSLAAIAIPSMSSGTESAVLTSMKSDAKNIFNEILSAKAKTGDFETHLSEGIFVDTNEIRTNGFYDPDKGTVFFNLNEPLNISISKGNNFEAYPLKCTLTGPYNGIEVVIQNPKYKNGLGAVIINSCSKGKMLVTPDLQTYLDQESYFY